MCCSQVRWREFAPVRCGGSGGTAEHVSEDLLAATDRHMAAEVLWPQYHWNAVLVLRHPGHASRDDHRDGRPNPNPMSPSCPFQCPSVAKEQSR